MIICNDGKCPSVRMGDANHSHEKILKSHDVDAEREKYDEIIIELTKERIEQTISNIASAETKSGLIIGFASAVISIILNVVSYQSFLFDFEKETWQIIVSWLPMTFLTLSIICNIPILFVRSRLKLIAPRATNNEHVNLSIPDFKKKLKETLINNFETIQKRRKYDWLLLNISISSLISASVTIFITLVLQKTGNI